MKNDLKTFKINVNHWTLQNRSNSFQWAYKTRFYLLDVQTFVGKKNNWNRNRIRDFQQKCFVKASPFFLWREISPKSTFSEISYSIVHSAALDVISLTHLISQKNLILSVFRAKTKTSFICAVILTKHWNSLSVFLKTHGWYM